MLTGTGAKPIWVACLFGELGPAPFALGICGTLPIWVILTDKRLRPPLAFTFEGAKPIWVPGMAFKLRPAPFTLTNRFATVPTGMLLTSYFRFSFVGTRTATILRGFTFGPVSLNFEVVITPFARLGDIWVGLAFVFALIRAVIADSGFNVRIFLPTVVAFAGNYRYAFPVAL